MLLSIIACGAVAASAAAGAAIGRRVEKSPTAPTRAARWAAIGILASSALATHAFVWLGPEDPAAFERDFDRNLQRVPFAWVLAEEDGDFRGQVLAATKAVFVKRGWPGADAALMRLVDERFPRVADMVLSADDAHIVAYGATMPPLLRRLQGESPSCNALLRERRWPPYPVAHAELTTAALAFAGAYRAARAGQAEGDAPAWPALSAEAEIEPLLAKLAAGPTAIPPVELRALREPTLASDAAFCAGVTKLYDNALSLPQRDAAAALRLILWSIADGRWAAMRDVAHGGDRRKPLDFRIEFDLVQSANLIGLLWLLPLVVVLAAVPPAAFLVVAPRLRPSLGPVVPRRRSLRRLIIGCSGVLAFLSLWELAWTHVDYATLLAAWQAGEYRTAEGVVRNHHRLADGDVSFQVGKEWFQLSDRFVTNGYNYAAWDDGKIHDGNFVRIAYVARDYRDPFSYFIRAYAGNTILRWADAEKMFGPGYGGEPLAGPGKARGAVIWSDGSDTRDRTVAIAEDEPPDLAAGFRAAGWDVFKLDRLIDDTGMSRDAAALADAAHRLKYRGYARIVLMGQSAGAWLSLRTAVESDDIDAVIANAPAIYGKGKRKPLNASELYQVLERVRHARIMLSFFDGDDFDPGGRAKPSEEILARRRIGHLVLDRPPELSGHGSGSSGLFARRFAPCALALAGGGTIPPLARCRNTSWGRTPSQELPVPAELGGALPRPRGTALDRYLGRWYGYFRSGQEVLFGIVEAKGTAVKAAYIIGPPVGGQSSGRATLREGSLRDAGLVFEGEDRMTVTLAWRPDGRLDATWSARGGGDSWHAVLRRPDGAKTAIPDR